MLVLSELKKQLLSQIVFRASSGLHFMQEHLLPQSGATDGAYSRSWYILISYNVDLILNAMLLLSIQSENENELFQKMKELGRCHNYAFMFDSVSVEVKEYCGINKVKKVNKKLKSNTYVEYHISTEEGEVVVQDFIDVRYDFKKKHGEGEGRRMNPKEVEEMKLEIVTLLAITKRLELLTC